MKKWCNLQLIFFLIVSIGFFLISPIQAAGQAPNHLFPKKVNYFLHWEITPAKAKELSRWDVVILDMEVQARNPDLLKKMREWNPNIILLVYISPIEINSDAGTSYSAMRRKLVERIPESHYLHTNTGSRITWWPGTYLLNITDESPVVDGKRLNDTMAEFVVNELLSSGLWDGVFYDGAWDNLTYFIDISTLDYTGDGLVDQNPDPHWQNGMKQLYTKTRERSGPHTLIVANSDTLVYANFVNGMMLENFHHFPWTDFMGRYAFFNEKTANPPFRLNIINSNTGNGGNTSDYKRFRFGLTSALLGNGYFSFDYGDKDHGQTWWYDEYGVNLGSSFGNTYSLQNHSLFTPDVWFRQFEHGLSVVNSTEATQTVDLGGEYEKIHGTQDDDINDGSIISEETLDGYDGRILLKVLSTLSDVLYTNGHFVRFFRPDGTRVRNGFFIFEEAYMGKDQIAHMDLNGDGLKDLFMSSRGKILGWRHDGQPLFTIYPYTANYRGELRIALGDLTGDGTKEMLVAPPKGKSAPLRLYDYNGQKIGDDWQPFGPKYSGGFSVAIGGKGSQQPFIVLGAGSGKAPLVGVYSPVRKIIKEWLAFESTFKGGVTVAVGDTDGDGEDEIVIGAGPGKKPLIRQFDLDGRQIGKEFSAYSTSQYPGIDVRVVDVDFDGIGDIVGMSSGGI